MTREHALMLNSPGKGQREEGIAVDTLSGSEWPVALYVRGCPGGWCGRVQPTRGGTIRRQVGLGGIGKAHEHHPGNRPVSSASPCVLLLFLLEFWL